MAPLWALFIKHRWDKKITLLMFNYGILLRFILFYMFTWEESINDLRYEQTLGLSCWGLRNFSQKLEAVFKLESVNRCATPRPFLANSWDGHFRQTKHEQKHFMPFFRQRQMIKTYRITIKSKKTKTNGFNLWPRRISSWSPRDGAFHWADGAVHTFPTAAVGA